jgi:Fe-S cluster assembly protein SufD
MMESSKIISHNQQSLLVENDFLFTEDLIPKTSNPDVNSYREKAWKNFVNLPMPSRKDEAWRRTDLHRMKAELFRIQNIDEPNSLFHLTNEYSEDFLKGGNLGGEIVLQPGEKRIFLSEELLAKGVIFTDLLSAEEKYPEIIRKIEGQIVHSDEGKFSALSAALADRGVLLYVPKGIKVEKPLHSLLSFSGKEAASFSHTLVWLEEDASVTYIHESASTTEEETQALHCGTVEIKVGTGAVLQFVELQSWGEHVWNFTHERAQVEREGTIDWIFGSIGSHLTKNFLDLDLISQGARGRMSGFYFANHDQHLDHDTQQNHLAPNTTSDLLFKGAVRDKGRSVWQGMIYVAPQAIHADGYQANRNLVLGPKARADSIPGLEILTDDVRCTHGATVGKIDADQVFYFLCRGIPQEEAEKTIVEGFFDPIMQRIPLEGIRERFQLDIQKKMEKSGK